MKTLTYLNINITYLIFTSIFFFVHEGSAQGRLNLSLNQVIDLAMESNWQVQKAKEMVGVAKSDLRISSSAFLPSINLSETYVSTTDPLSAFGFKLQQQRASTNDFNPSLLNDPGTIDNFKTRLYAEQPIINIDAINSRKAAQAGVQAAEFNMKWAKNLMTLQTKNLYFLLQLAHKKREVIQRSLDAGNASYKVANDLFDQGLIHQADLLSAQLRVTEIESEMIAAENQINDTNAKLVHFIGLDRSKSIYPLDSLSTSQILKVYVDDIEISKGRSDLLALSSQVEASIQMLKSSKGTLLPRLNAFGSYEWNGDNLFGTSGNNYTLGARFEWDIFKGGRNLAKIQKAKYQKNIAEINYSEKLSEGHHELDKARRKLLLAQKQVELADLAVKQSEQNYKVRTDRFEEGLERTSDVLQAESDLRFKRISHLQSINELQQLIFRLEILLEQELTI